MLYLIKKLSEAHNNNIIVYSPDDAITNTVHA